jgi:hypothetical protein
LLYIDVSLVPIAVVLYKGYTLRGAELAEGVRTVVQERIRALGELIALLFDELLIEWQVGGEGGQAEEEWRRLRQPDHQGSVIQRFDTHGLGSRLARIEVRTPLDIVSEDACVLARRIGVHRPQPSVLEVLGGHRLPIAPLDAVAQLKGIG